MKVNFKKTGFKKVIVAALAAVIGLASCTTDAIVDNMNNGGSSSGVYSDSKSVTLKVASKLPTTRSEGSSIAAQETVKFNNGWLLFVSAQNNVTKVMEIKTGTSTMNDSEVDISLLIQSGGVEIENVPGHSTSVYVIGNLPAGGGITVPAVGVSLTNLKQNLIAFSTQDDIHNVTLFGGDAIKIENTKNVARFSLSPIVARIEIAKISSTGGSSDISSFKVEGIFINNYYENITLEGNAPAVAKKNTDIADFAGNSTAYPDTYEGILYDYRSAAGQSLGVPHATEANTYTPTTGAWAYNLLAPKTGTPPDMLTAPHIIIAVSDIQTNSGTEYNGIWYLTVKNMVHQNNKITHLEPGKVYSIKNINFSHTNIQPEPEMKTIDVDVEVTLVEWEIIDTDVIFGQD
ncbi:MAG: hypothetical protein LBC19_11550 [Tannerella sp.]|jgi:hypothetical protein|nr:hypothetical protein [Tannerella sp.]